MATAKSKRSSKLKPLPGAPLVETDISELGDNKLNPEESVIRERESLLAHRHREHAYPGQEQLIQADRSIGNRLHYSEVILRLNKLNPSILVKDGIQGHVALYRRKTKAEMDRDGYDLARPQWYNEHKYVTGFPKDFLPEWGHLTTDTDGIAEREVRGWRSVLIAFMKHGVITYAQATEQFGDPANDQRSNFWFQHLKVN